jgi:hypothetical protein
MSRKKGGPFKAGASDRPKKEGKYEKSGKAIGYLKHKIY